MEIATALSAANAALALLKTGVAARDQGKIDEAISVLKDRLFDAQSANIEVVEKLHQSQAERHALVEELKQFRARVSERALYVLENIGEGGISFMAYRYNRERGLEAGRLDADHYLCQSCFDNPASHRKAALSINKGLATCSGCVTHTRFADPDWKPQPIGYPRRSVT